MFTKCILIEQLHKEYELWKDLFADLNEDQAIAQIVDGEWTIKDIFVHLTAWQKLSLARLRAAKAKTEPEYSDWYPGFEPETNKDTNRVNAAIQEQGRNTEWKEVFDNWWRQFDQILSVSESIAEADFNTVGKYAWLPGHALAAVLEGTLEHHREHRESLLDHLSGSSLEPDRPQP